MDCEFITQYLLLSGLPRVEGEPTVKTIRRAIAAGRLVANDGEGLVRSVLVQSAILQALRIAGEKSMQAETVPEGLRRLLVEMTQAALEQASPNSSAAPGSGFSAVTGLLEAIQAETREVFRRVLNVPEKASA